MYTIHTHIIKYTHRRVRPLTYFCWFKKHSIKSSFAFPKSPKSKKNSAST